MIGGEWLEDSVFESESVSQSLQPEHPRGEGSGILRTAYLEATKCIFFFFLVVSVAP